MQFLEISWWIKKCANMADYIRIHQLWWLYTSYTWQPRYGCNDVKIFNNAQPFLKNFIA